NTRSTTVSGRTATRAPYLGTCGRSTAPRRGRRIRRGLRAHRSSLWSRGSTASSWPGTPAASPHRGRNRRCRTRARGRRATRFAPEARPPAPQKGRCFREHETELLGVRCLKRTLPAPPPKQVQSVPSRVMPLTRDQTRGTGLAVAVDLVNTWDELEDEPDLIEGLADVRYWLDWHGLHTAAKRLRSAGLDRGRELRTRFDRVFDACGEAEAAGLLNELSREYGTPPQLERATGGWRLRSWPDEREGLPAVAAYATAGLLEAFRSLGWPRFGRC